MQIKRILLKLSGESLMGADGYGINYSAVDHFASEIESAVAMGVQVGVVIGGGNTKKDLTGLGNLLLMAQSGQYNFLRCLQHGEPEAAQLACGEFVTAALKAFFLLQKRYLPYYKWSFRALRQTEDGAELAGKLSFVLLGDHRSEEDAMRKYAMIEEIAGDFITRLQDADLTKAICGDLEKHAYSVNDRIADGTVRNLHILAAV